MTVEEHDSVLALTSHLPHMLAYTLVDTLAQRSQNNSIFRYAAGGFKDFTRIMGVIRPCGTTLRLPIVMRF